MRALTGVLSLLLVLATFGAQAQDIFRRAGDLILLPTGNTYRAAPDQSGNPQPFLPQVTDNAGYRYRATTAGVQCYHPDNPAESYRIFNGDNFYDANGSIRGPSGAHVALAADGNGVEAAYVQRQLDTPQSDFERLRVFRFDCSMLQFDGQGGTGGVRVGGDVRPSVDPLFVPNDFYAAFIKRGPDTFCFANAGVVCVDLSGEVPVARSLVAIDALDALLDPALIPWPRHVPPISQRWSISGLMATPDDRIFFIADFNYDVDLSLSGNVRYIIELRADGTLKPRFGPIGRLGPLGLNPLQGVKKIMYHAELDALLAWPVEGNEFNWETWLAGNAGWSGYGLRVLPMTSAANPDPGSGYLGLSGPLTPLIERCGTTATCFPVAAEMFEGKLLVEMLASGNPSVYATDIHELYFDPERLDLDADGLSAAEERALGTSDTRPDSDFGATPDGIEVRVCHSDPTSAVGEPSRARADAPLGTVSYVSSPLIQKALPALDFDSMHPFNTQTFGVEGPLCMGGACYGPGGAVVFRYPDERSDTRMAVVSYDGTFVMLDTPAGLVRFWFADGREELAVSRADFDAYVPTSQFTRQFIPIDGKRTWLISSGLDHPEQYPAAIALAEGDEITVVYDQNKVLRDSGLINEAGVPIAGAGQNLLSTFEVIGWNHVTEQLHIGIYTTWETWLIGLGADHSLTVLSRASAMKGINGEQPDWLRGNATGAPPEFPLYIRPTGHGDFFTTGSVMEPFGGFSPTHYPLQIIHESATGQPVPAPDRGPRGIWGDVILEIVCCNFFEDGFYERVRYDQSVSPGDLLVLRPGETAVGSMLSRIGPRGGLSNLWSSDFSDIKEAVGMDLAPDGSMRLCIADAGSGTLWELEPAGPRAAPEVFRYAQDVPGITDCAYEADGALRVIAKNPARTLLRPAGDDFAELVPGPTMAPRPDPIELVRKPDGSIETRLAGDGLRGKTYLPDGRAVTMAEGGFDLVVEGGDTLGLPPPIYQNFLGGPGYNLDHPVDVALAVRPDGLVVVLPHNAEVTNNYAVLGRPYAVDMTTRGIHELVVGSLGGAGPLAIATVPGGSGADPWTGAIGGSRTVTLPPDVSAPPLPSAPQGGESVAAEDTGCAAMPGRPGGCVWFVLVALGVGLRRRRARRAWPSRLSNGGRAGPKRR